MFATNITPKTIVMNENIEFDLLAAECILYFIDLFLPLCCIIQKRKSFVTFLKRMAERERWRQKIKTKIENKEFYEAQQLVKTLNFR